MYASLSILEITFYTLTWCFGVFFGGYKLWKEVDIYNPNRDKDYEFGQITLSGEIYVFDFEWLVWIPFLLFKTPWLVSHFVGAELVRKNNIELLPVWYILISGIFLLNYVGALTTGFVLLQLSLMFLCKIIKSNLLIWIVGSIILLSMTGQWDFMGMLLPLERRQLYLINIACCWSLLRSMSYCSDGLSQPSPEQSSTSDPSSGAGGDTASSTGSKCVSDLSNESQRPVAVDFVLYLSYCLYLPTLFFGPLIIYSDFQPGLKQPYKRWTFMRVVCAICSLLRYVFWAFVIDFCLHFLYFQVLILYPRKARSLGNWALYGFAYTIGHFFMLKYVVIYGVSATIARLEQIDAPPHPKCIARIHLYSDMWRYFDRGLYKFIFKYIYSPCCGVKPNYWKRLFASFMCFVFVFIWHATYKVIFIWSVLNFLGVTAEGIGKLIGRYPAYRRWEDSFLSPRGIRRFHALLASPVFLMSVLSNMYFLGSYYIGNLFFQRISEDTLLHNLYLLWFCYCCSQVSIEVSNWEKRRTILTTKQKSQ